MRIGNSDRVGACLPHATPPVTPRGTILSILDVVALRTERILLLAGYWQWGLMLFQVRGHGILMIQAYEAASV